MAVNLAVEEAVPRERRLGSITGYTGTLKDLATKGCQGCLKNKEREFTTESFCSHMHTLNQLSGIRDTVVIDHSPVGCSASQVEFNEAGVSGARREGLPGENFHQISTNIIETDTVFGAVEKVRAAIQLGYDRYHPKQIFVVQSCVACIIGEDLDGLIDEMSQELGIPIGYTPSPGFKSRVWASGFDGYNHVVGRTLIKEKSEKSNTINYIGFMPIGKDYLEGLFKELGYDMICLTGGASAEDFQKATGSVASFGQCGAQSSYMCGLLEKHYGVKYFQSHLPYGGIGLERFFREVADYVGKSEQAEEIIKREREKYHAKVEELKSKLSGKKVFIALGASFAYEYTRMCKELGMDVLHTVAYHYDPKVDNNSDDKIAAAVDVEELGMDVPTSVSDVQMVEQLITLKNNWPDIVIGRAHSITAWAAQLGLPSVETKVGLRVVGYPGLIDLGERLVRQLKNTNFEKKLRERYVSPFTNYYENLAPFSMFVEGGKKHGN